MDIRIAGYENDSIVDGPGFRFTVFTQGCPHHCPGCHNPETHDFEGGRIVDTDAVIKEFSNHILLDGITLSGGEPLMQPAPCTELAKKAHAIGLNVWCYTGYTIERLLEENDRERMELLHNVDVLVDSPFLILQRTLELRFRGSKNQRLIDVQSTLASGTVVLYEL